MPQEILEAYFQYEAGEITYVQFVRYVNSCVTEEDVREHNGTIPRPTDGGSAVGDAERPFVG